MYGISLKRVYLLRAFRGITWGTGEVEPELEGPGTAFEVELKGRLDSDGPVLPVPENVPVDSVVVVLHPARELTGTMGVSSRGDGSLIEGTMGGDGVL
jgi:hypothetical protein